MTESDNLSLPDWTELWLRAVEESKSADSAQLLGIVCSLHTHLDRLLEHHSRALAEDILAGVDEHKSPHVSKTTEVAHALATLPHLPDLKSFPCDDNEYHELLGRIRHNKQLLQSPSFVLVESLAGKQLSEEEMLAMRPLLAANSIRTMALEVADKNLGGQRALKFEALRLGRTAAEIDSLTGLPNRRWIERFRVENPDNLGTCTARLDLDDFKRINDAFGHIQADDILRHFANWLVEATHGYGECVRVGGDEFAVIFSACDVDAANELINSAFASLKMPEEYGPITLSVSVGLASGTDAKAEENADEAQRRAKSVAGNSVVLAQP